MLRLCLVNILFGVLVLLKLSAGYYFHHEDENKNREKFHANLKHLFHQSYATKAETICCANGQWEANAYIIAGTKLTIENITMIIYYNGTGKIAFDEVNKKSYISFNVTEFTPGVPKQYHKTSTVIKDFATGISYSIDDGDCSELPDAGTMQIVCVPENAKQVSKGVFGGMDVTTYQFSSGNPPLEVLTTPTVRQNGSYCEAVMFSYALFSDGGVQEFVYDVDVVDLSQGIKDPSIFVPPTPCH